MPRQRQPRRPEPGGTLFARAVRRSGRQSVDIPITVTSSALGGRPRLRRRRQRTTVDAFYSIRVEASPPRQPFGKPRADAAKIQRGSSSSSVLKALIRRKNVRVSEYKWPSQSSTLVIRSSPSSAGAYRRDRPGPTRRLPVSIPIRQRPERGPRAGDRRCPFTRQFNGFVHVSLRQSLFCEMRP
jgi:hypothetical protein